MIPGGSGWTSTGWPSSSGATSESDRPEEGLIDEAVLQDLDRVEAARLSVRLAVAATTVVELAAGPDGATALLAATALQVGILRYTAHPTSPASGTLLTVVAVNGRGVSPPPPAAR